MAAEFLTPEEVAQSCRVTTQTVLNWIGAGKLPAVRLSPRIVRIPKGAFERFVVGGAPGTHSTRQRATRVKPLKTLEQLAREQGVSPTKRFEDLLGDFWPPEDDVDDFLSAIRDAQAPRARGRTARASRRA